MRTIKYTSRFKRDYRREKSGIHGKKPDALLKSILGFLAEDTEYRKLLRCEGMAAERRIQRPAA